MAAPHLTRSIVKLNIQDGDRVFLVDTRNYTPETNDHRQCWPKIIAAIKKNGERGAMYATLRAIGGSNKNYAAYLIGQLHVLRCPALEGRLRISNDS
jgi:hypothetical protein